MICTASRTHKTETTLPLDGRDGRSCVWWGFKKNRARITFWPPPHNSRVNRISRVNRREAIGQLVDVEDTDEEPPVTCPLPDDLPRAYRPFSRAAPPFKSHPCGTLWSIRARSWHLHISRLSPYVCPCVRVYRLPSDTMSLTLADFADARYKCLRCVL